MDKERLEEEVNRLQKLLGSNYTVIQKNKAILIYEKYIKPNHESLDHPCFPNGIQVYLN